MTLKSFTKPFSKAGYLDSTETFCFYHICLVRRVYHILGVPAWLSNCQTFNPSLFHLLNSLFVPLSFANSSSNLINSTSLTFTKMKFLPFLSAYSIFECSPLCFLSASNIFCLKFCVQRWQEQEKEEPQFQGQ